MNSFVDRLSELFTLKPETTDKIVASAAVIILLIIIRFIALRIVYRRTDDIRRRYNWRKGTTYTAATIGFLVLGRIWFTGFQALTTYLGLVSAGLAIAMRDPLVNLAAWVFIMWRRPFTVGDRIEIGNHKGDVTDLRIFQFTLMEIGNWVDADQSTGRIIRIPNGKVFTDTLANYSKGFMFIWNEIPVLVTFESNWKKCKEILNEIAIKHAEHLSERAAERVKEASARMMVFYTTLTPIVYTTVRDSGILLTVRYLCKPRQRRGTEEEIWEDILTRFAECDDIDFAYPTVRRYNNVLEGKPGARADIASPTAPASGDSESD
ncbi:MAG TPA: mechanosensitive ion channel family protein [candidate division Zixibacteria bacterium]|nr:mechanosensitive ion channel family protein [candidate division Zixibacteria bacterium]